MSNLVRIKDCQDKLQKEICAFFAKWTKSQLGTGPLRCRVKFCDNILFVRTYGVLSKAELALCAKGEGLLEVKLHRCKLMKAILPSLKEGIFKITGIPVTQTFCDIDPSVNEAMMVIILKENLE